MSGAFVPVDDEVAITVLIEDLIALAPIADKAFNAELSGQKWKLWYNRSLDAINLQPTDAFLQCKPTNKVGIRRTPATNSLSFYHQNTLTTGIPEGLKSAIPVLAEQVRKAKKLLDKGAHFDADSLKLIFEFMKDGSMDSANPFLVILGQGSEYFLWTKTIRPAPSAAELRARIEPKSKTYLNVQDKDSFHVCVQENKLGLEIDEEGRVTAVMTDGRTRDPSEIEAVLFDSEGIWNKRLTKIIKRILAFKGCKIEESVIKVHQLTIEKVPEVVLRKWGKVWEKLQRVNYMNNRFQEGPGSDYGGLTKQFFSDVTRALFDGRKGRHFKVDETGCPMVSEGSQPDEVLCKLFGRFLTEVCKRNLVIGRVFPECFFALLRILAMTAEPSEARTIDIVRMFAGEYQRPIVAWLSGENSQKDQALEMMSYAGEDGLEEMSEEQQRIKATTYLNRFVEPYVAVATAIARGIHAPLSHLLVSKSAEEVSATIQGAKLDAEDIAARIKLPHDNQVLQEKVAFLKEHIRERLAAADTDWVERFLFCVTGQRAVQGCTIIRVNPSFDTLCRAHTCSNCLDVPVTHSTPPAEVKGHRERFICNLEMTMAETGFSLA